MVAKFPRSPLLFAIYFSLSILTLQDVIAECTDAAFVLRGISADRNRRLSLLSRPPCAYSKYCDNDGDGPVFRRKQGAWRLASTSGGEDSENDDFSPDSGSDGSDGPSDSWTGTSSDWTQKLYDDEGAADGASDDLSLLPPSDGGDDDDTDDSENWLDALAAIAREEVNFIEAEADRADRAREMQELGFTPEQIGGTLDVATSQELEDEDAGEEFAEFRRATSGMEGGFGMMTYDEDEIDKKEVESHLTVEKDEDGETIRAQMVYVDEVTCIGCTNCANIAQSTFFMEDEHGRARVFDQWGDDEETIQVAIDTCPVDCIHYIPYEELVRLETERRGQNINFKARLVNQGEYGGGVSQRVGSSVAFTGAQQISGNMGYRCSNCPSRGCKDCPMFGVGNNPEFKLREEKREKRRKEKRLKAQLEELDRSADL